MFMNMVSSIDWPAKCPVQVSIEDGWLDVGGGGAK